MMNADSTLLATFSEPFCFIYRLPIDVLQSIFIEYASDYFRGRSGCPISTPPSWVNVSYVSHPWRDAALHCPILWTYLFILSPRWTEELLARSKQAPLKIYADLQCHDKRRRGFHFVKQVMDHVERIQELRIELFLHDYPVLSELSSPAPCLRHLEIWMTGRSSNRSFLPFNGDTPALHTLVLHACPVPWYSLKWADLTTLYLESVPIRFRQNPSEFLATLSRMQNLQHLQLKDALASATEFPSSVTFESFEKISLPRLSELCLICPLSTMIAVLSFVNIPTTTQVRLRPVLRSQPNSSSPDHFTALSSVLTETYSVSRDPALPIPPICSLVIARSNGTRRKLTFSISELEHSCESFSSRLLIDWDCRVPLQILLSFDDLTTTDDTNHITSRICSSMPLSNVRNLHVADPPSSLAFWTDVLGHLPDLRLLKLSHGTMPDLTPILSAAPTNSTGNDDGQIGLRQSPLVPALVELELFDIRISSDLRGLTNSPGVRSLLRALSTRTLGAPGRLTIRCCVEYSTDFPMERFDLDASWGDGRWVITSHDEHDYERAPVEGRLKS